MKWYLIIMSLLYCSSSDESSSATEDPAIWPPLETPITWLWDDHTSCPLAAGQPGKLLQHLLTRATRPVHLKPLTIKVMFQYLVLLLTAYVFRHSFDFLLALVVSETAYILLVVILSISHTFYHNNCLFNISFFSWWVTENNQPIVNLTFYYNTYTAITHRWCLFVSDHNISPL